MSVPAAPAASALPARVEVSWRGRPVTRRELITLGVIGALVIFSRLDLMFLVAYAGVWVVFRTSPIRYLLPLDVVAVTFSVLLAFVIKASFPDYYELATVAATMVAVSLLVEIPLAYLFGLYQKDRISQAGKLLPAMVLFVASSSAIVGVIMILAARALSFVSFPRIVLVYDAIFQKKNPHQQSH